MQYIIFVQISLISKNILSKSLNFVSYSSCFFFLFRLFYRALSADKIYKDSHIKTTILTVLIILYFYKITLIIFLFYNNASKYSLLRISDFLKSLSESTANSTVRYPSYPCALISSGVYFVYIWNFHIFHIIRHNHSS